MNEYDPILDWRVWLIALALEVGVIALEALYSSGWNLWIWLGY